MHGQQTSWDRVNTGKVMGSRSLSRAERWARAERSLALRETSHRQEVWLCWAGRCLAIQRVGAMGGIPVLDELRLVLEFSGRNKTDWRGEGGPQEGGSYLFSTVYGALGSSPNSWNVAEPGFHPRLASHSCLPHQAIWVCCCL